MEGMGGGHQLVVICLGSFMHPLAHGTGLICNELIYKNNIIKKS